MALLVLGGAHGAVLAVNKCEIDGKISYSDAPCLNGKSHKLAEPSPPSDAEGAKRQLAQDKLALTRLEKQRYRQEAKDARAQNQAARRGAATQKKCARLTLRKKWIDEDVAQTAGKAGAKARTKAKRFNEKYTLECGKR